MMPVAILCGGLGTRLKPLTDDTPKYLVDVNGQPFAVHQLALLKAAGYTDIVLCVGHLKEQIYTTLGNGSHLGLNIEYSADCDGPSGTAAAITRALPLLGDAFFTLYGDSYLDCDYGQVEALFNLNHRNVMTWWNGQDYGLSAFRMSDFKYHAKRTADLTTVQTTLRLNDRLTYFPMRQAWREMGSPEGLADLKQHLLDHAPLNT